MLTFQFERREVMVESCGRPAIRGVTLAAIRAKATLVRIIAVVAGIAILLRHLEVTNTAGVDMALVTGDTHMLPRDFEGKGIVIEVPSEAIHTVVATETGRTKGLRMHRHEAYVDLTVAAIAGVEGEGCDI